MWQKLSQEFEKRFAELLLVVVVIAQTGTLP